MFLGRVSSLFLLTESYYTKTNVVKSKGKANKDLLVRLILKSVSSLDQDYNDSADNIAVFRSD